MTTDTISWIVSIALVIVLWRPAMRAEARRQQMMNDFRKES